MLSSATNLMSWGSVVGFMGAPGLVGHRLNASTCRMQKVHHVENRIHVFFKHGDTVPSKLSSCDFNEVRARRRLAPLRGAPVEILPPVVVAAGYYAGCLAGFAARFPWSGISFFWPPTGLLAAALMLSRPRTWPCAASRCIRGARGGPRPERRPDCRMAHPIPGQRHAGQPGGVYRPPSLQRARCFYGDLRTILTFILGACVVAPAVASLIPAYAYVHMGWATRLLAGLARPDRLEFRCLADAGSVVGSCCGNICGHDREWFRRAWASTGCCCSACSPHTRPPVISSERMCSALVGGALCAGAVPALGDHPVRRCGLVRGAAVDNASHHLERIRGARSSCQQCGRRHRHCDSAVPDRDGSAHDADRRAFSNRTAQNTRAPRG